MLLSEEAGLPPKQADGVNVINGVPGMPTEGVLNRKPIKLFRTGQAVLLGASTTGDMGRFKTTATGKSAQDFVFVEFKAVVTERVGYTEKIERLIDRSHDSLDGIRWRGWILKHRIGQTPRSEPQVTTGRRKRTRSKSDHNGICPAQLELCNAEMFSLGHRSEFRRSHKTSLGLPSVTEPVKRWIYLELDRRLNQTRAVIERSPISGGIQHQEFRYPDIGLATRG